MQGQLLIFVFAQLCILSTPINSFSEQSEQHENSQQNPICIVGGGITGLNIATLLQNQGRRVHLFEKEGELGGKLKTFRDAQRGVQIDTAAFFIIAHYRRVLALVAQLNLTLSPYDHLSRGKFDPVTGQIGSIPPPQLSPTLLMTMWAASKSYLAHRSAYFENGHSVTSDPFGYVNASSDLFMSMDQWLDQRNLTILKPVFYYLTLSGYGTIEDMPALIFVRLVDRPFLQNLLKTKDVYFVLKDGISELIKGMKERIEVNNGKGQGQGQVTFSLNSRVASILRSSANLQTVGYIQGTMKSSGTDKLTVTPMTSEGYSSFNCSKTILAFPPLLAHLGPVIRDLEEYERDVLAQVKIHWFLTSGVHLPPLNKAIYEVCRPTSETNGFGDGGEPQPVNMDTCVYSEEPGKFGVGEVISMAKQSLQREQSDYGAYSWIRGDFDTLPEEQHLRLMEQKAAVLFQKLSPKSHIFLQKATDYYPHVQFSAMKTGFYNKFFKMQGHRGLYYASTLFTYELMENALQLSEEFVQQFFK